MWLSADGPATPVAKDAGISLMVSQYTKLPLKNWVQHPDRSKNSALKVALVMRSRYYLRNV
jgi:hypothetical protein